MEKTEIAQLVVKARENDNKAQEELYKATSKQAYFVALKMTKDEDEAMNILHDSYIKAFKNLDKLEKTEQFQSWFNQIVANGCRDFFKKKKAILFTETENEDGGDISDTFEEGDETLMPDKALDNDETKRLVMEIIEGLSEDQKLCVLMYYYENMSVGDIAESLECSTGTVKSRLNYARQKIKTEVENLEKKQGIKLYGIAPIPFVIWVLTRTAESTVVPQAIAGAVFGTTATGAVAGTATAGTAGATAVSGKVIAVAAAGVIAVGGGTAAAVALSNNYDLTGYVYEYSEEIDGMIITDYNGDAVELRIPKKIEGEEVKEIGEYAFEGCYSIVSVEFPDTVTEIGRYAFYGCTNLAEITIPDSVTEIGYGAFWWCTSLTEITIPDSVTKIGRGAFEECTSLTEITIPDGVTEIGEETFEDCTSLIEITIPDGVTEIGVDAFRECTSLTEITIPDSVTEIGIEAFCKCTSLTEITIPDSVTVIEFGAFSGCTSLTEITIPDSVTEIGYCAFNSCDNLTITYRGQQYTAEEFEEAYPFQ